MLGQHRGLAHYTVGQRKGLGGAGGADGAVLALDPATRRVTVGPRSAGRTRIALRDVNWLADEAETFRCEVKLRAREAPHAATVRRTEAGAAVELDTPALAAPGQACVMYRGSRMLGGGFICPPSTGAGALTKSGVSGITGAPRWQRSSVVEQGNHNPLVGGSNPSAATNPAGERRHQSVAYP